MNLSIKNVPDEIVERLRRRAARNHRSLQGELMEIIEGTVESEKQLTADELLNRVRRMGLSTPAESVKIIRANRNAR
ncbi:MAG TPA: Arc family DNA-binding protein [Acidobacteriota bacterium]